MARTCTNRPPSSVCSRRITENWRWRSFIAKSGSLDSDWLNHSSCVRIRVRADNVYLGFSDTRSTRNVYLEGHEALPAPGSGVEIRISCFGASVWGPIVFVYWGLSVICITRAWCCERERRDSRGRVWRTSGLLRSPEQRKKLGIGVAARCGIQWLVKCSARASVAFVRRVKASTSS